MTSVTSKIIAVKGSEVSKWGCPYCGYRSIGTPISGGGTAVCRCGECHNEFAALADGLNKSTIGFGDFYPELQDHPRAGTPSHGKPDLRPKSGGEFFRSRGIGLDLCPCFVCGTKYRDEENQYIYNHNIAAYVQCKAAGERVVAMFPQGARLDYREYEPDYVQVKVGACDKHLANLKVLNFQVRKGVITEEMLNISVPVTRNEAWAYTGSTIVMAVSKHVIYPLRNSLQNIKYWPRMIRRKINRKIKR